MASPLRRSHKRLHGFLRFFFAAVMLFCLPFFAACQPATPPEPDGLAGTAVHGSLPDWKNTWPGGLPTVYAARFLSSGGEDGVFVLDPDHDPSTRIDRQGGFTLLISSTGDYVLLAGEDVSSAVVLTDENHHRKVIHIDGSLAEMDAGVLYVMP